MRKLVILSILTLLMISLLSFQVVAQSCDAGEMNFNWIENGEFEGPDGIIGWGVEVLGDNIIPEEGIFHAPGQGFNGGDAVTLSLDNNLPGKNSNNDDHLARFFYNGTGERPALLLTNETVFATKVRYEIFDDRNNDWGNHGCPTHDGTTEPEWNGGAIKVRYNDSRGQVRDIAILLNKHSYNNNSGSNSLGNANSERLIHQVVPGLQLERLGSEKCLKNRKGEYSIGVALDHNTMDNALSQPQSVFTENRNPQGWKDLQINLADLYDEVGVDHNFPPREGNESVLQVEYNILIWGRGNGNNDDVLNLTIDDAVLNGTCMFTPPGEETCILDTVDWNTGSCNLVGEGQDVTIDVGTDSNCVNNQQVNLQVFERDLTSSDDEATTHPDPANIDAGDDSGSTTWVAEYEDDEGVGNPEYYAIGELDGVQIESPDIEVVPCNVNDDSDCDGIDDFDESGTIQIDLCLDSTPCDDVDETGCVPGSGSATCASLWDCSDVPWQNLCATEGKRTRDVGSGCGAFETLAQCNCKFAQELPPAEREAQFDLCSGFTLVNERVCIIEEEFPVFSLVNVVMVLGLLSLFYLGRRKA